MNSIERLTEYFTHFPGIGPRQAKRFVYHLLTRDQATLYQFTELIKNLRTETTCCDRCFRFFQKKRADQTSCSICSDTRRASLLMIVPRDSDLDQVERAHAFDGLYFVLGGTVPILDKRQSERIRIDKLKERILQDFDILEEIILAANLNPEGEHTMEYVENELKPLLSPSVRITHLGRGFSTGSEIEYADAETIKYALKSRF